MNLQTYLKLTALIKEDNSTKAQRRAFFIKHKLEERSKLQQLLFWIQKQPIPRETENHPFFKATKVSLFLSFLFGIFTAVALLNYSGNAPVNVIYFFTIAVVFPLFSMLLSLFSLLFPKQFSPFFLTRYLQKFIIKFFSKETTTINMDKDLEHSYTLFFIQLASLLFSIALLLSFLFIIFTQDIAFSWSTTLTVEPNSFYSFLHTLSLPFANFCPQSLVSLEVIEKTHYFRLGQSITPQMQNNASLYGEWWHFLACATLFYAVFLRLILLGFSYIQLQNSLKKALLRIDGTTELLNDMNTPLITTQSPDTEKIQRTQDKTLQQIKHLDNYYDKVLGWAFLNDELLLAQEALNVKTKQSLIVGGNQTLEEENHITKTLDGNILLLTKSWEIPTMEFIDFLEAAAKQASSITICPLGYQERNYQTKMKDTKVWEKKIASQNFINVSIKL